MSAEKITRKRSLKASSIYTPACLGKRVPNTKPALNKKHDLSPCTATASMFIYSQGNMVICAQRETLIVEQRFLRHVEEVHLLEADTVSGRGDGKLVVSCDVGKTAIVWDCTTGDEMARFSSQENLTVAAWMRNGNIAFGDELGNVILFELNTSENLYVKTIDQLSITALAPAVDCRTYAIGFSNGSLYIATLQPCFTVLHDLTTSKITTSITTLAWHASSPRQKSILLATQYSDGNLRVWSIPKYHVCTETAKIMRILQRTDKVQNGPHWSAWSKNGRIIQFCEREIWSWDVRTKNVTYEAVPTPEIVKGLAIYGPGAILFTLSQNNSVQQFNLKSPLHIVANVQHSTNRISTLIQIPEEKERRQGILKSSDERGTTNMQIGTDTLGDDRNEIITTFSSNSRENYRLEDPENYMISQSDILSPISVRSYVSKTSRSSGGLQNISNISREISDETTISTGSSLHSSQGYSLDSSHGSISPSSSSSRSINSHNSTFKNPHSHHKARPNHIQLSDLFKYTKYRLFDEVDRRPEALDTSKLTNHDCRRQMFRIIFGWDGEAEGLIEDEISRQPFGSVTRFLLAKWLGDIDFNIMSPMSESMTYSDWMLLALCGINGAGKHETQNKIARAYVQRLLREGDIHTAATFMISMGDKNDAIEIYVSHKRYMEALILTCYVFPADWQRQAQLIRKWGEWAVQHSQHNLAIRCFSCTVSEFTQPWYSPDYHGNRFPTLQTEICTQSPPDSPLSARETQTSNTKTSALKLITSFEGASGKIPCSGINEHEKYLNDTVSSSVEHQFSHVASLRSENQSVYNTPASERTATPGGFQRQRLPSIGEMPSDDLPVGKADNLSLTNYSEGNPETLRNQVHKLNETVNIKKTGSKPKNLNPKIPMIQRSRNFLIAPLSLSASLETSLMSQAARNISENFDDPKNDSPEISWPPMKDIITGNYMTSPGSSIESSRHRNEKQNFVNSCVSIASKAPEVIASRTEREESHSDLVQTENLAPTSQIIDYYIDILESAQYQFRNEQSRDLKLKNSISSEHSENSIANSKSDGSTEERELPVTECKKYLEPSPLFPKATAGNLPDLSSNSPSNNKAHLNARNQIMGKRRHALKSSFSQDSSPSSLNESSWIKPAINVINNDQIRLFPDTDKIGEDKIGKGKYREESSSLMKSGRLCDNDNNHNEKSDCSDEGSRHSDEQNYLKFPSSSRNILCNRRLEDAGERKKIRNGSAHNFKQNVHSRSASDAVVIDLRAIAEKKISRKEQAARELKARRKSLAKRPSAPPIIHPEQLDRLSLAYSHSPNDKTRVHIGSESKKIHTQPSRSKTTPPESTRVCQMIFEERDEEKKSRVRKGWANQIGLPANPRALKYLQHDAVGSKLFSPPGNNETGDNLESYSCGKSDVRYHKDGFETLPPLPMTTYKATRRIPPRSASAPIIEETFYPHALPLDLPTHPAFQSSLPPSSIRRGSDSKCFDGLLPLRKPNSGDLQTSYHGNTTRNIANQAHDQGNLNYEMDSTCTKIRHEQHESNSPPPSPTPPILKELQHLAIPPPPPPPPYPNTGINMDSSSPNISSGSGIIEIIMDEGISTSMSDNKPTSKASSLEKPLDHNSCSSQNDDTKSIRFTQAKRRFRSASHGWIGARIPLNNSNLNQSAATWTAGRNKNGTQGGQRSGISSIMNQWYPKESQGVAKIVEGGMI